MNARISLVSSYDDDNLRRSALEAGASEYIVKENLLDIVDVLAQA